MNRDVVRRWLGLANSTNRNCWLAKTLKALPAGSTILDAGAGELRNKPLCAHLKYTAQDLCQYEGRGNGEGLQTEHWSTEGIDIVSDVSAIPVADASFDAVLCSEVLEHIPDPVKAVKEFARVLKPEGVLILTAPFSSLTHFAPYHYCTGFSRYWYEHHLNSHGFTILEMQPNGNWFACVRQELCRVPLVGKAYSSVAVAWLTFLLSLPSIFALRYLERKRVDTGSSELLCFGWHVLAKLHRVSS